jgi:hypothetical protein
MYRTALPFVLVLSGCLASSAMQQQQQAVAAMHAQNAPRIAAAEASMHTGKFIRAARAWLCTDDAAAAMNAPCRDGIEVLRNEDVMVVGTQPVNGVWPVAVYDAQGEHRRSIAASVVADLPDLTALDAYAVDVATRIPAARQLHFDTITFDKLLAEPDAFRGKLLVVRQRTDEVTNEQYDAKTSTYTFTIPIQVTTNSNWAALAQFELVNKKVVEERIERRHAHSCTTAYCDKLVIVAELTGRTVDRVDQTGAVHRLPVFAVRELGDRFGVYR